MRKITASEGKYFTQKKMEEGFEKQSLSDGSEVK